jgi:hypothetical protein
VHGRNIEAAQLVLSAKWLDGESEVPEGLWRGHFPA